MIKVNDNIYLKGKKKSWEKEKQELLCFHFKAIINVSENEASMTWILDIE